MFIFSMPTIKADVVQLHVQALVKLLKTIQCVESESLSEAIYNVSFTSISEKIIVRKNIQKCRTTSPYA